MSRAELKRRAKAQLGGSLFHNNWLMALIAVLLCNIINSAAAAVVVGSIIVTGPLSYGLSFLFLKQARDGQSMEIGDAFRGFSDDFSGTLLIGLMSGIFVTLWSLLFFIPGIVKSYSYSMAYYIKADNPDYTWNQCITESRMMMKGHKWELFILELSFICWAIVCTFTFGIGYLWLAPYMSATKAQFYNNLKTGA